MRRLPTAERGLEMARDELRAALADRGRAGSLSDELVKSGAHWALRAAVDPIETDAGISFLVGLVSGFHAAASLPITRIKRLRAEERRVYAEMAAASSDDGVDTTDLDDLPIADGDHYVNYFYGRLAAFDAALRSSEALEVS